MNLDSSNLDSPQVPGPDVLAHPVRTKVPAQCSTGSADSSFLPPPGRNLGNAQSIAALDPDHLPPRQYLAVQQEGDGVLQMAVPLEHRSRPAFENLPQCPAPLS